MNISDMEYKLNELRKQLYKLTEIVERENYQEKGLDVNFDTSVGTRGSKKEIDHIKSEIEKLESQIKEAKNAQERHEKEKSEREVSEEIEAEERKKKKEEAKENEEFEKEMAKIQKSDQRKKFELVKKMYKRGPFFYRLFDKISPFRGPKWSEIKKYTEEELDFLVQLANGDTLFQKEKEYSVERHGIEKTDKDRKWSNWWAFMKALESRYQLKNKIEIDEEMERNSHGIF